MSGSTVYHFRSAAGTFWIINQHANPDSWYLGVTAGGRSKMLRTFHSAQGAAVAVGARLTGWPEWDRRTREEGEPQSLEQWTAGPPPGDSLTL